MNELNTWLQRKAQYVSEMYWHIKGFMNKLRLWHAHIQNANLSHFPTLKEMGMRPEKKTEFADELEKSFNEFSACFKDFKPHELEKSFNEFSACFKDFKSHEHLFEIFSSPFHAALVSFMTSVWRECMILFVLS